MSDRWYFAYGSNLDTDQMEHRTGNIRETRRTHLDGYRVVFNKLGGDNTGKANITSDAKGVVWGVVYRCNPDELERMDKSEGVSGGHYFRKGVRVKCDSGEVLDAVTYVAGESFIRTNIEPSPDYLARIIRGAREHDLLEDYIQGIQDTAQKND